VPYINTRVSQLTETLLSDVPSGAINWHALIGLTEFVGDPAAAGAQDLGATVASILSIAVGVLCATLILEGSGATHRVVTAASRAARAHKRGLRRFQKRPGGDAW
jgi:hypothetical protein